MSFRTEVFTSSSEYYQTSLSIRKNVFIDEQKIDPALEIDAFENQCTYFLTFFHGEAVSTGRLRESGEKIKFERIATLKAFRGKGCGAVLMDAMLLYAKEKYSLYKPFMHAQLEAAGFYEKIGWIRVGPEFTEADIPHVAMTVPDKS